MHARIGPAALKQHVAAIPLPRFGKCRRDNGAAMVASLKARMGYDIRQDPVLTTATQQIGDGDEHAGRDDPCIRIGHEDRKTIARQGLLPDLLGPRPWFRAAADVGRAKQSARTEPRSAISARRASGTNAISRSRNRFAG
jgi:hypothetical protein